MDPKLSKLDPKLQDAYKRVMGGNDNSPQQPPQAQNQAQSAPLPPEQTQPIQQNPYTAPAPESSPPPAPETPTPPPAPESTTPPPAPTTPPPPSQESQTPQNPPQQDQTTQHQNPEYRMPSSSSTVAFNAQNSSKNKGTSLEKKKGGMGGLVPVFVGIGIVMLLVIYTFVWVIIFDIEVPILSEFV